MRSSTDIQIEYIDRMVKEPCAAGEIKFQVASSQRAGRCFYTDWIDTKLGAGRHDLNFYIIDDMGFDDEPVQNERLLWGEIQVFQQSEYIPSVSAVRSFFGNRNRKIPLGTSAAEWDDAWHDPRRLECSEGRDPYR